MAAQTSREDLAWIDRRCAFRSRRFDLSIWIPLCWCDFRGIDLRCCGRKEWGIPVMKVVISASGRLARSLGVVVAAGLMGAFSLCDVAAGQTAAPRASDVPLRDSWRTSIAKVPLPHEGCFTASYPDMKWTEVGCVAAPSQPFLAEDASPDGSHQGLCRCRDGTYVGSIRVLPVRQRPKIGKRRRRGQHVRPPTQFQFHAQRQGLQKRRRSEPVSRLATIHL